MNKHFRGLHVVELGKPVRSRGFIVARIMSFIVKQWQEVAY